MRHLVVFVLFLFPFCGFTQEVIPDPPVIDSISVDTSNNGILHTIIGWEPYDWTGYDTDSSGFIIREVIVGVGYINPDTIRDPFATFYMDYSTTPASQIYGYGLVAYSIVDGLFLKSDIADQFSRNMRLQISEYDSCQRAVKLNWNTYFTDEEPSAPNDPPYHVVAVSSTDKREVVSDTNVYTFSGLNKNETYTFFVRIYGAGYSSTSNPVSRLIRTPDPAAMPCFNSLYTTGSFSNEITAHVDEQTTGQLLILRSGSENGTYDTIFRTGNISGNNVSYTDAGTGKNVVYYSLVAKDACLSGPVQSDTLNTIILEADLKKEFVDLDANEELRYDSTYTLYRKANGNWESFNISPPVEYNDFAIMDITLENPIVTYYIEAKKNTATIHSNPVSVNIQDDLLWPNAIIAGHYGIDGKFRAFVQRTIPEEFNLKIYSKWGELLFETNDLEESWDGTYKGNTVPPGAYLYVATYKFTDQKPKTVKGTVTVIH